MARSESDKRRLKENAKELFASNVNVEADSDETAGANDFKYEEFPNVCAVVVDLGSGQGFVRITGGGKETETFYTGRGEQGFVSANISSGQTCMLYGLPTVLYIRPRST